MEEWMDEVLSADREFIDKLLDRLEAKYWS